MFILRCRDTILNNSIIFIFFLVDVCGWACCGACGCQRAAFKGEGSLPLVGSGDAAWAVRQAQQALLSAELSCWPPTLVFKSSSVLWYFGCWSQETEIYASFFYFFHPFGQCALKPFICSLFFLWAYAVPTCSWFLLPSVQNCVFLLVFLKRQFPLFRNLRDRPLIQLNKYLNWISRFFFFLLSSPMKWSLLCKGYIPFQKF